MIQAKYLNFKQRLKYSSGLPHSPPGDLLTQGSNLHFLTFLHWQAGGFFTISVAWEPIYIYSIKIKRITAYFPKIVTLQENSRSKTNNILFMSTFTNVMRKTRDAYNITTFQMPKAQQTPVYHLKLTLLK